jgi:hypothetical protein
MEQQSIPDLEQRLVAAERLLSTLIAVLSARDPGLLDDLEAVFAKPEFASDKAGRAATETWRRIAGGLAATRSLVYGDKGPWPPVE